MPNFYGSSCQLKMNNRCRRVAINLTHFSQTAALNIYILFLFNYMFQKLQKSGKIKRVVTFSLLKNIFSLILVICIIFIYFRYKKILHFSFAINYLYRYLYILYMLLITSVPNFSRINNVSNLCYLFSRISFQSLDV